MKFVYNAPIKFNIPNISFGSKTFIKPNIVSKPIKDSFSTNPLYEKFGDRVEIEIIAKNNPRIQALLNKHNIPLKVNMKELEELKKGHLNDTRVIAAQIYSSLPAELKKEVNLSELQEAALLHDYGKVLIPESILNKKGKLTDAEREIMELHSELSYELLKNKGLSEKTLKLIKYHHQNLNKNGYPKIDKNFDVGLDCQILNVADKYAALRESRSYKSPLAKYEALEIIAKDVNKGQVSQEVYTALVKSA